MKKEYDQSKMLSAKNPYAGKLYMKGRLPSGLKRLGLVSQLKSQ